MDECPVCKKEIPERDALTLTSSGTCGVCGLTLMAATPAIAHERTSQEVAREAEIKRLQRIAFGPQTKSAQMTKMKGFLALLIMTCLLVYGYVWDRARKQTQEKNHIEVTFRAFNVMFGPGSDLSDEEKLEEFKYWRSSPITWKGTITYVNLGAENDLYVTVRHSSRLPASDVLIRFDEAWRDRLAELKVGQALRYRGRISEFDRGASFVTVRKGTIICEPK